MLETHSACLRERIDANYLATPSGCSLQGCEHARMIRSRILSNNKNGISDLEISKSHRALSYSDCLIQPATARLVTHIGTVGKIVSPKLPDKELIEKGSLVARTARSVKDSLIGRVECVQF